MIEEQNKNINEICCIGIYIYLHYVKLHGFINNVNLILIKVKKKLKMCKLNF